MTAFSLRALVLVAAATCAFADATYNLAASPPSRVELVVTKTGFLRGKQHLFVFDRFHGVLRYAVAAPETSHVRFEIAAASIVCKDTWVSASDLRKIRDVATKDMLDVDRHPAITFSSSSIRPTSAETFEVRGNLTIRGVTRPAILAVSVRGKADGALSIEGRTQVRLTDYNLKPPTAAFGTIGTKDEMEFTFNLAARPE